MQGWLKGIEGFVKEKAEKDAPELRKEHLNTVMMAKQQQKGQKAGTKEQQQKDGSWELDKPGKKGGKGGGKKGGGGSQQMGKK